MRHSMHRRYFKSEFDQWGVELSMSTRHYKSTVLCCAFSFPFLSVTRQTYQRTVPPLVMRSLKCVSFLLWMVILLATIGSFGTTAHRGRHCYFFFLHVHARAKAFHSSSFPPLVLGVNCMCVTHWYTLFDEKTLMCLLSVLRIADGNERSRNQAGKNCKSWHNL